MSTVTDSGEDAAQNENEDDDVIVVNGSPPTERVSTSNGDVSDQAVPETESSVSSEPASEDPVQEVEESTEDGAAPDTAEAPDAQSETDPDPAESESTASGTTAPEPTPEEPTAEQPDAEEGSSSTADGHSEADVEDTDAEEAADGSEEVEGSEETETDILDLKDQPSTFSLTAEASVIKDVLQAVNKVVDEFRLRMTEDELRIRAVDAANVAMIDVSIDPAVFESYTATPGVIGVNLQKFKEAVSLADSSDTISMAINPETRKMEIQVNDLDYTMGLIDPRSVRQDPDLPDLDLPAEMLIEGRAFGQGIKAADMVGDHVKISTIPESGGLTIEAEGDTDSVVQTIPERDLVDSTTPHGEEIDSMFSLEYLTSINRALPNSDPIKMNLGDEFPMDLSYDTAGGDLEVRFMLAPRIQAD